MSINVFSCQKTQEEKYTSPPPPLSAITINNTITKKHINIPNTKIYLIPLDEKYTLNNSTLMSNHYAIQVFESDDKTIKNTLEDFDGKGFEAKGIKVFDEKFITINGVKSKILFIQGQPQMKGAIIFIDNKSEKVMINTYYSANDLLENKVKDMLHTIVYDKNAKIDYLKNTNFKINLTGTNLKFHKFAASSYFFTENGEEASIEKPQIIINQVPNEYKNRLEDLFKELIESSKKYGLEKVEIKNVIKNENSYEAEIYGEIKGSKTLMFNKIISNPSKDYILIFNGSSRENLEKSLTDFKKVSSTFDFK